VASTASRNQRLDKLSRLTSPLTVVRKDPGLHQAHWTEPKMIAEVAFTEWTSDGSIRHPSFQKDVAGGYLMHNGEVESFEKRTPSRNARHDMGGHQEGKQ
jgi:hypothetical protein